VRGKPLDEYGNLFTVLSLPNDGWRTAHDSEKWLIERLAREAGIEIRVEVMGLFIHLIQQRERFLGLPFRKRQGTVPDILITLMPPTRTLSDIKRIYCGSSVHNLYSGAAQNEQCGAVLRRQRLVHSDSHRSARKLDTDFNGCNPQEGGMGPVQSALDAFGRVEGYVFGAFGEASPDVHKLTRQIGDLGGARGWRDMGARSPCEASSMLANRAKRLLGIEATRGHARLKLDRLASVTGDADAGAERRSKSRFGSRCYRNEYARRFGPKIWQTGGRTR
jgi:hypothetical protein